MKSLSKFARAMAIASLGLVSVVGAACSPEDLAAVKAHHESLAAQSSNSLSDAALDRLAACESGGRASVVSSNGLYHGLYQFNQTTWNGIARQVDPSWVGTAPSHAPAFVQDAMARKLYDQRGSQPWPVCGRRI